MTAPEPATTVSIASGPLVGPILRRVVGMLADRFGAQIRAEWLQSGPEVWQVRLERVAAPV